VVQNILKSLPLLPKENSFLNFETGKFDKGTNKGGKYKPILSIPTNLFSLIIFNRPLSLIHPLIELNNFYQVLNVVFKLLFYLNTFHLYQIDSGAK